MTIPRLSIAARARAVPLTALALALVLTGCDRAAQAPEADMALKEQVVAEAMPAPAPMARMAAADGAGGAAQSAAGVQDSPEAQRHIAVRQMLTVESPGEQLPALWEKVRAQCAALRCELLQASLRQQTPRQPAGASLSLRVAPEDVDKLLGALQGGGLVVQQDSSSEDLTAQVIDVQAHIRNRTEFRDSLRALLARADGQRALKDVLEIQRTLTQTQSELDSHAAQLKALQSRTRMQQIDIEFRAEQRMVSGGGDNPIARAWAQAGETLAESAAAVISFVAAALPWLPVLLLPLWGLRVMWRRKKARQG
ncbi:DUF4349 domain-containing protein [Xenophilus arseniciresistens]|uniref:DUF4349 domain-containing protein n=1 Tax=Xenophilus arseniciresistens TaxID=1283306 RepID=A0AAE3N8M9_9BURK|nr:DUF4349 domain-containing protein [Xenophilus arseniciresistens]MDA7416958.1 DUF4349 domain-containing protein [Xenophilus arseniciresistens]